MRITFNEDDFGRLVCTVDHAVGSSVMTASDPVAAGAELMAALEEVRSDGYAECFWHEAHGDYRWMFRLTGQQVAIAALWSSGTVTGWEHIFQGETPVDEFERQVRSGLARLGTP